MKYGKGGTKETRKTMHRFIETFAISFLESHSREKNQRFFTYLKKYIYKKDLKTRRRTFFKKVESKRLRF
jgi:hypothetical protein